MKRYARRLDLISSNLHAFIDLFAKKAHEERMAMIERDRRSLGQKFRHILKGRPC